MKLLCLFFTVLGVSGCAGLIVYPLTETQASKAHKKEWATDSDALSGYIVYHPMIVVEVVNKEVCTSRSGDGICSGVKNVCGFGQIIYMPDYKKPYIVNSKNGLGKAGVEIQIKNGWMLSGLKDNSDNTALLDKLFADAVLATKSDKTPPCAKTGLYRLNDDPKTIDSKPLKKVQLWEKL